MILGKHALVLLPSSCNTNTFDKLIPINHNKNNTWCIRSTRKIFVFSVPSINQLAMTNFNHTPSSWWITSISYANLLYISKSMTNRCLSKHKIAWNWLFMMKLLLNLFTTLGLPTYLRSFDIRYILKVTYLNSVPRCFTICTISGPTHCIPTLFCVISFYYNTIFPHVSHNASEKYPKMHHLQQKCAHVCTFLLQEDALIVGYETSALWDLWDWSIIAFCTCSDIYAYEFIGKLKMLTSVPT